VRVVTLFPSHFVKIFCFYNALVYFTFYFVVSAVDTSLSLHMLLAIEFFDLVSSQCENATNLRKEKLLNLCVSKMALLEAEAGGGEGQDRVLPEFIPIYERDLF
jgi:hypothetical protein